MWNHINDVWCSNKESQINYVKKWIIAMVSGQKMTTALYLRSIEEGTGKTIVMDFLQKKVLGKDITYTLDNPSSWEGFNSHLYVKLLVVCEEMPSNSKGQWMKLVETFKTWITNDTKNFEGKYSPAFNGENVSSFVILTNNEAFKLGVSDRRFVMLDVSKKYLGNADYFDSLAECIEGPDSEEIGEAFYWYCIEEYEKYLKENNGKKFNPSSAKERPITKTKQTTIIEHLHTFYVFLKRYYLANEKGLPRIQMKVLRKIYIEELHKDAKRLKEGKANYYSNHDVDVSSRKLNELLKDIDIKASKSTGNQLYVPELSYKKLMNKFIERNWIDEFDGIKDYELDEVSQKKTNKFHEILNFMETYNKPNLKKYIDDYFNIINPVKSEPPEVINKIVDDLIQTQQDDEIEFIEDDEDDEEIEEKSEEKLREKSEEKPGNKQYVIMEDIEILNELDNVDDDDDDE
jgi:hypothetical protein